MCQMSMKLPAMFDQNPPHTFRDANFPDAEIVRSEERGGHGPSAGPGGVQVQRHFRGPGQICHRISDVIEQI